MMKSIIQKAVDFARDRYRQGRPFFAQPDEAVDWLHPDIPRVPMQNVSGDVRLPNQTGRVGR